MVVVWDRLSGGLVFVLSVMKSYTLVGGQTNKGGGGADGVLFFFPLFFYTFFILTKNMGFIFCWFVDHLALFRRLVGVPELSSWQFWKFRVVDFGLCKLTQKSWILYKEIKYLKSLPIARNSKKARDASSTLLLSTAYPYWIIWMTFVAYIICKSFYIPESY